MRRFLLIAVLAALFVAPLARAWTWPSDGLVLQSFSFDASHPYASGQHRGIDVAGSAGGPVVAPAGGTVTFAGSVPSSGKTVSIATSDGYTVTLTHLGSIAVSKGATVDEGATVGTIGPSGDPEVDGPYVHLGIRSTSNDQGYLDPLSFLPGRVAAPPALVPAPPPPADPAQPGDTAPADAAPADAAQVDAAPVDAAPADAAPADPAPPATDPAPSDPAAADAAPAAEPAPVTPATDPAPQPAPVPAPAVPASVPADPAPVTAAAPSAVAPAPAPVPAPAPQPSADDPVAPADLPVTAPVASAAPAPVPADVVVPVAPVPGPAVRRATAPPELPVLSKHVVSQHVVSQRVVSQQVATKAARPPVRVSRGVPTSVPRVTGSVRAHSEPRAASAPRSVDVPRHTTAGVAARAAAAHRRSVLLPVAAVLTGALALAALGARRKRVRIIARDGSEPEEDPGRAGVALCSRVPAPRPRRRLRRAGRCVRALPPAQGQRRPDGERDGRAWHAGDGRGGSRGEVLR